MPNRPRSAMHSGLDAAMEYDVPMTHLFLARSNEFVESVSFQSSLRRLSPSMMPQALLVAMTHANFHFRSCEPQSPAVRSALPQQKSNAAPTPNASWDSMRGKCRGTTHAELVSKQHKKRTTPRTTAGSQTPGMQFATSHRGTFECHDSCTAAHQSEAWFDPRTWPQTSAVSK